MYYISNSEGGGWSENLMTWTNDGHEWEYYESESEAKEYAEFLDGVVETC